MTKAAKLAALASGLALLAGCSIAGTWRTVRVEPPDRQDALMAAVTFSRDNLYTATVRYEGRATTATGQYQWNGRRLRLTPKGGAQYEFAGELRFGKTLILTRMVDNVKVTGTLEKQPGP